MNDRFVIHEHGVPEEMLDQECVMSTKKKLEQILSPVFSVVNIEESLEDEIVGEILELFEKGYKKRKAKREGLTKRQKIRKIIKDCRAGKKYVCEDAVVDELMEL